MATRKKPAGTQFILDPDAPPYRRFPDSPSGVFVDHVSEHIRNTGQPETCEGLYRGRLPKNAKYKIVRKITIDRKKRPEMDNAPCPMCTPNRFLEGALVWCYDLQVVSVIGHCCAEYAYEAEREFKRVETIRRQEDYLLLALPQLAQKRATLDALKGSAGEALKLYRHFRRRLPQLHQHLRQIKEKDNATLRLAEVLTGGENGGTRDYFGPAGFGGRGGSEVQSRDHVFGMMAGTTALLKDYRPHVELSDAIRDANVFSFSGDEEAAIEFIVKLTTAERTAAVAICQSLDSRFTKFTSRIQDFRTFWSAENIDRLNRYGTSPFNGFPFEARRTVMHGRPVVSIRQGRIEFRSVISTKLDDLAREWQVFTYKRP